MWRLVIIMVLSKDTEHHDQSIGEPVYPGAMLWQGNNLKRSCSSEMAVAGFFSLTMLLPGPCDLPHSNTTTLPEDMSISDRADSPPIHQTLIALLQLWHKPSLEKYTFPYPPTMSSVPRKKECIWWWWWVNGAQHQQKSTALHPLGR